MYVYIYDMINIINVLQLDLPAYSNAETLKEKLLLAISEGMEGFGFA